MNDVKRVTVQYRVDVDKLPGEATRLLGVAREKTKDLHTYLSKVDLNNTKSCTGFLSEEGKQRCLCKLGDHFRCNLRLSDSNERLSRFGFWPKRGPGPGRTPRSRTAREIA